MGPIPEQLELPLVNETPLERELRERYEATIADAETCYTCDGAGVITVDQFSPRRGHWTKESPCPNCTT